MWFRQDTISLTEGARFRWGRGTTSWGAGYEVVAERYEVVGAEHELLGSRHDFIGARTRLHEGPGTISQSQSMTSWGSTQDFVEPGHDVMEVQHDFASAFHGITSRDYEFLGSDDTRRTLSICFRPSTSARYCYLADEIM